MSFLKNLFSSSRSTGTFYSYSVKCNRCSETIQGRVNLHNDPSLEVDENGNASYICRKVLIGGEHCFQQIEVVFNFNEERKLTKKQITGGEFIED